MKSDVKHILIRDGCMPEYETANEFDIVVSHDSFRVLAAQLVRDNMHIIAIHQGLLEIKDDETYMRINGDRRISVLYKKKRNT
jgi:hypothetical protein